MSLQNLGYVCSHLQNCLNVSLPMAAIPFNRLHLQLAVGLYKNGFINSVTRGSIAGPDATPVEVTPDNISTRKLWLGLKYKNSKPVMSKLKLVSKPNRRISFNKVELSDLAHGKKVRIVEPLLPGEILFLKVEGSNEVVELHEAVKKGLAGTLLCRVK
ncbi:unnamed protein product [Kuraishia capsulata CBS 1993]|uniref:Ribosomal protein S8 n=1 Tax=Kuraishia capsulata CBS 1993 TaxID=1382522 RepID=W6MHL7_9ASCO|nr:uncharacterized protein KUCA_T00001456001 [Kuraishia capsulata CBS 1993]CDK25486.1 unnamed protein product [Kuraishia capsulata CBS 1993]